ncbi:peptidase inhibitor family I36 protein [Kibdelosporangium philippinense]|uniref:Peptidase inhibitor family I36 protein n=1 Tax=Kibdelosporangium philippinense TaxID=211113 RepID=A0ABS8Z3P0_9PSEU|nr:peptidase inhibitor family I36 protein [Kibdelosporangium philippinense]MCE7001987.1 peptidase inhibitor family I36 protein [Kibdelosporangium philippinense]
MTKKRFIGVVVAGLIALGVTLAPATSAANSSWSGCPSNSLCMWKHSDGRGTKAIVPLPSNRTSLNWDMSRLPFLNGESSDNQVSSWAFDRICVLDLYDSLGQRDPLAHVREKEQNAAIMSIDNMISSFTITCR